MRTFVYTSASTSILCTSSGPFLLQALGNSDDGVTGAAIDIVPIYYENTNSHKAGHVVVGGNAGEAISIFATNNSPTPMPVLITMQTTKGAVARCDEN